MLILRRTQSIQAIYLYLILGNTLAASLIWGINTIFLLDAGLTNFQAFLANAFFTLGQVLFEVPTGVIADTFGRRVSYLLGALTLMSSIWSYSTSYLVAAFIQLIALPFIFLAKKENVASDKILTAKE